MIVDKLNDIINGNNESSTIINLCIFIKENITTINDMTIDEIASACFMSKGQVSKCIRKLDYKNYEEFKYACNDYNDSLITRTGIFKHEYTLKQNIEQYTNSYINTLLNILPVINYSLLQELTNDIINSHKIYVYGHGDVRTVCYMMQRELNTMNKSVIICDVDYVKKYHYQDSDLLIMLSTNGQTFHYHKRIVSRILKEQVSKWLITCQSEIDFPDKKFVIPTRNSVYNESLMLYLINLLLMNIKHNL